MSEFLTNFHFIRPWILLLLVFPLISLWYKFKIHKTASSWEDVCDKNLLSFLLIKENKLSFLSLKKILYIGIFSAIIAAAGPSWKKNEIPTFVVENPNMFVLSLAQDMALNDITPSRLDRAKFVISDLADAFPQGQFGIEVYSEEPYIISPISDDANLLKNLLPQITPNIVPDQGDRLDRAINLAIERFHSAGYAHGNIIIFASDVGQRFDLALESIQKAAQLNYKIYIVDSSFSGSEKLKLLANKGNGFYISVKDTNFQPLINSINNMNEEQIKLSQNMRSNFIDYGYYLLIIPLLCTLIFFRRGVLFLFLLLFSFNAQASFFLNNDQMALRHFNNNDYEKASQMFQNSVWKGASFYKAGKMEEALKEFEKSNTSTAFYNKGLTLAKLCQYDKAKEAFQAALALNPQNEDAQYNLSVINDLYEKAKSDPSVLSCGDNQQQSPNSQNDNKNNEQQNNQNSSDNSQQNSPQNDEQAKNNEQNSANNDEQQSSSEQEQQNENQSQQNASKNNQKQEDNQQQSANTDETTQNNQNQTTEDALSEENKDGDNQNTPSKANQDQGQNQKSQNKNGNEQNGTENQQEEQAVNLVNAQQGNKDDKYDEEAVIMQRQYRDIPDDTGGLLREFIKKEYSKGRYRDENM